VVHDRSGLIDSFDVANPRRLHMRPKPVDAHFDVCCLGEHTRSLASPEHCVLIGDLNLAPCADLKPSPMIGGVDAFTKLRAADFRPANLARTNLAALSSADGGKCRDNFLVHSTLFEPEKHMAALKLEEFSAAPDASGDAKVWAFVAQLDVLLLAEARAQSVPQKWLLEGLTVAAGDPRSSIHAMLDAAIQAADGTGAAAGSGDAAVGEAADGDAGGSRNAAARGLCQLGLFDHCFSFIDLSVVN